VKEVSVSEFTIRVTRDGVKRAIDRADKGDVSNGCVDTTDESVGKTMEQLGEIELRDM
jgi:hypothetical protein